MDNEFSTETLLIIPCCARKLSGGLILGDYADPLRNMVPENVYSSILDARGCVLDAVKAKPQYMNEKYAKNRDIQDGPDLGGKSRSGLYSIALSRYTGKLYSVPMLKPTIEEMLAREDGPKMLILSALYGPLHPYSPIQNYNLMMGDAPAKAWGSAFPRFLSAYVRQNSIKNVVMYLGSGTSYFTVAKKAVKSLLETGQLSRGMQYHVMNGSTPTTPLQHGLRFLDDLDPRSLTGFPRSFGIVENIF